MKRLYLLLSALSIGACDVEVAQDEKPGSDVQYIAVPGSADMDLPFSAAVRVDNLLFLSGALGIVPGTRDLAEGGIRAETRQTLENISSTLENAGSSMQQVVKCTVFLADISDWAAMTEEYTTFFENKPARTAIGTGGIPLDGRLEIECIAVVD